MRAVAHSAAKFSDPHLFGGKVEALQVALHFAEPVGNLQTESNRLGVNSVRAPDLRGVLKLQCATLQHHEEFFDAGPQQYRSLLHEQRLRGVHYIVRRQSVVQPARLGTNLFRHGRSEGDDVMLDLGLYLVNPRNFKRRTFHADGAGSGLGDDACFGERFAGGYFHLQPGTELFSSLQIRPISGRV